ncbi:ABC transporter permease [Pseudonocardia sp. WMMC193]|uniref:ABC transporter permease n=1 Tax=Pseudonocardia sp. WMMC193 TaxID=2911965 RepID=UPI001F2AAB3B|nr:ABC transporter permease [Pseudonocardia sp. WMMC193]MCF7548033.1 ABC transporter permease [Pseudonocardia sp. WMMC193]
MTGALSTRRPPRWLPAVLPVVLLAAWEVAGRLAGNVYLPPLSRTLEVFATTWFPGVVVHDVLPSLARFLGGFLLAAVLGIVLGLAIGMSRTLDDYLRPTLEFLRALPAVAVLPVAVFVLGLGDSMRISVIVFGVVFPVLVNAAAGARSVRPERVETARMFGLSRFAVARRVVLPSALPMISAGLRVALPIALIMMVVSELVGGQNGLGFYLTYQQQSFNIPAMFAAVIVLGVLGNVLNAGYAAVERRVLHWARHA